MHCGWAAWTEIDINQIMRCTHSEFDCVNILTILAFDLECEMFWNCVIRVNLPVLLVVVVVVRQDMIGYIVKLMFWLAYDTHRVCAHLRLYIFSFFFSNARENLALWVAFQPQWPPSPPPPHLLYCTLLQCTVCVCVYFVTFYFACSLVYLFIQFPYTHRERAREIG